MFADRIDHGANIQLIEGDGAAAAQEVDAPVRGDGEEPRAKTAAGLIGVQAGVGANKGFLRGVLGVGTVAEQAVGQAIDGALVAIDQGDKSGGVAGKSPQHKGIVGVIGKRRRLRGHTDADAVEWGGEYSNQGSILHAI
ncbi:MAG: hypothetical protein U0232_10700 [Thermomicrobiales bacterium]